MPIHDYGEINGQLYLDMRLIDGTNLATVLKRSGPMSPPRAVAIMRQVAAALDAAHAGGVTHRDVKPENILITDDDFAYLLDFGIARADTDPGLTQAGMALGTYKYMAPERFTDNDVTYRSDIYSLACVLGECLTGASPFRADSIEQLVAAHLMEPAPRPSQLRPGQVPAALDQVIAQGMAKNPEDRYRSAGELANAALHALTCPSSTRLKAFCSTARMPPTHTPWFVPRRPPRVRGVGLPGPPVPAVGVSTPAVRYPVDRTPPSNPTSVPLRRNGATDASCG